jgi:hypothetical protein
MAAAGVSLGLSILVGVLAFRSSVEAASGQRFGDISAQQVRFFSSVGYGRHAGILATGLVFAPVVSCIGVLAARRRWWGWFLLIGPFLATTQIPGRTLTLTTGVTTALFWAYTRPTGIPKLAPSSSKGGSRRISTILLVAMFALLGVVYFQTTSDTLKKSQPITGGSPQASYLPAALAPTVLYLTGSPAAFSAAFDERFDPTSGHHMRTVWLVPRLLSLVDPRVTAPDTVAASVEVPTNFNTYTWMGDIWFDWGAVGLLVGGLLLGAAVGLADNRARHRGSAVAAFQGATILAALLNPLTLTILGLEVVLVLLFGSLVFQVTVRTRRTQFQPALL